MSIFQALTVGITAVQAQSNALGMISDNIANVNTVGYKRSSALFRDMLGNDSAINYSPAGANSMQRSINIAQGDLISGDSNTNLAITGGGFFAVTQTATSATSSSILYTRAGAFEPDVNGNLVNGAGFFLQGWRLNDDGTLPAGLNDANGVASGTAIGSLQTVNIAHLDAVPIATTTVAPRINLQASQLPLANSSVTMQANLDSAQQALPTTNVTMAANLTPATTAFAGAYDPTMSSENMASGAIAPNFSHTVSIIDNTGAARTLRTSFLKTGADTWAVEVSVDPESDVTQTDGQVASGTVTFNPDGSLATISPALTSPVTVDWNNAGGPTTLALNFGTVGATDGLSELAGTYTAAFTASPDYDPTDPAKSMASGAVTPDFTQNVTVTDNTGTVHTLTAGFLKTGDNTWAIEIYGQPPSDVTAPPGAVAGQAAFGTATFNSNGSLVSISPSLSNPIPVGWNGDSQDNTVSFGWQSVGGVGGLAQSNSAYSASMSSTKNYDPSIPADNMSSGSVLAQFDRSVTVIDDAGQTHTLTMGFLKTAVNSWAVEIYSDPATDTASGNPQVAAGTMTFNGDGSLASVSPSLSGPIDVAWQSGAGSAITFNWGTAGPILGTPGAAVIGLTNGMSQFDSDFNVTSVTQNGSLADQLTSVTVTDDGTVVGTYNDGTVRDFYKVPLAVFTDANELQTISGNAFAPTVKASDPLFFQGNTDVAGKISAGELESSNVDLQTQLTDMIIAQRAYQTNTKTITTADEMLQTLTTMLGTPT